MTEATRIHRISILAEYEGEPMTEDQLHTFMVDAGDMLAQNLRKRHEGADQIFTMGARQDLNLKRYT